MRQSRVRNKRLVIAVVIAGVAIVIGVNTAVIVIDMFVTRDAYERCLAQASCTWSPPPSTDDSEYR